MGKMYMFFTMLSLAMFSFSCYENNNPLDENGTNYIPPKITINEDASSVKNLDTVHFDSIVIVLEGNHERSLFNLKMDDGAWAKEWKSEGMFSFGKLSDGKHTMHINSMYREGNVVVSDSVVFHVLTKGYKPEFTTAKDTTIELFEGNSVSLSVKAEGRSPLNYSWFKGTSVLEGKNSDTLKITSFTVNDSASYQCIVTNEYGKAASRLFILKCRPFSGGIKGVIADSSGNKLKKATVTLSPSDKKDTTDVAGSFAFSSLSRNIYTLKISMPEFHDTTLSEIAVNDSETVILPTITLKMIAAATFEIIYNGNSSDGGTIPVDTAHYKQGNKAMVAAIGDLSRSGYTFTNWNMKRDGSGDSFTPGDSFTIRDDVTFHAQWTALPGFKVAYNKNGADTGTVPVDNNSYYMGKEVTVAGNPGNLHKEGYSFSGWNMKADGTGVTYNAGAKLPMPDSALTLYVKWTTNPTYSIIYHGTTSTGGDVPAMVNADSGMQITITDSGSLYKIGYTFFGWNTKEDGSGKAYKAGDKIIMGIVDIDLYIQWTKAQYTITYYGNGNTGGTVPPKTTHLYQTEITIAGSGDLLRTGHSFLGWNTDSIGNGLDFSEGNKMVIDKNINLYARWLKKKYKITFSGNGDRTSNVPDIIEYKYGSKIDSAAVLPSRESYIFNGWFRNSSCTEKWRYATDSIATSDTLYAKWIIMDVDGNIYTEVKINNQVWIVENLKTTRYLDGKSIQLISNNEQWENDSNGAFCWYQNNPDNFKNEYGALYNWYAVNTGKLAIKGWHVASQEEWDKLISYLGGYNVAGGKLKETGFQHWGDLNPVISDSTTNFIALGGGYRDEYGAYNDLYIFGMWWTSIAGTSNTAYRYYMNCNDTEARYSLANIKNGFSIRCIRDW